jgi:D-alanyl-D-alanine carboxypeptidase
MLLRSMQSGLLRAAFMIVLGLGALATATAITSDTALAAKKRGPSQAGAKKYKSIAVRKGKPVRTARAGRTRHAAAAEGPSNPRFAAIVYDVKAGSTLYAANADSLRHPASVTKVMTLFMLFEQLEAGRLSLDSRLAVSAHAAAQAPTKLGLRAGSTLRVEDAILGMVTRSANDAAVVVAEALGGTEPAFAAMMTRKARSLGMSRTVYRNASGLPDPGQVTTARDLATLGIAIQDRFPRYFRYFSTRSFVYQGRGIASHNRLVGSVDGVDGIKTGYTRASGFNLLTSLRRGDRQVVAVVLGGRSGSSRDATMRQLLADYVPRAYAGARRAGPVLARVEDAAPLPKPKGQPAQTSQPLSPAHELLVQADMLEPGLAATPAQPRPAPAPAARGAVRPAVIADAPKAKADGPVAAPVRRAEAASPAMASAKPSPRPSAKPAVEAAPTQEGGPVLRWVQGPAPVTAPATRPARTSVSVDTAPDTTSAVQLVRTKTFLVDEGSDVAQLASLEATDASAAAPQPAAAAPADNPASEGPARSGWIIQIGATDNEAAARKLLDRARSSAERALASSEGFTESVDKNGSRLWRARFAGFGDQKKANAACAALKSRAFACMVARL